MIPLATRKTQLEARLAVLGARMKSVEEELDSHVEPDWEDLATQREGDEVLEGIGLSAQQEVRMIKAALGRVAAGGYGRCVTCDARISEARLDLLPSTPFCVDCAQAHQEASEQGDTR